MEAGTAKIAGAGRARESHSVPSLVEAQVDISQSVGTVLSRVRAIKDNLGLIPKPEDPHPTTPIEEAKFGLRAIAGAQQRTYVTLHEIQGVLDEIESVL